MRPFLLTITLAIAVQAQPAPLPKVSPDRLKRLDTVLEGYVDHDQVPGIVALVLQDGKPVYERAFGWADKEGRRKRTSNTIFRSASKSKAITSAAVMILVEEGKIGITEPVGHFIPSFSKTTVAVKSDSGIHTVPAKRPITIADLLTHTA